VVEVVEVVVTFQAEVVAVMLPLQAHQTSQFDFLHTKLEVGLSV
jgi:hypothetical protein